MASPVVLPLRSSHLLLVAVLCACGDSSTGPDTPPQFLRATVDGQAWEADRGSQTLLGELSSGGILSIVGVDRASSTSISIGVASFVGVDSYPLGPIPGSSAVYVEPGPPGLAYSFATTATHTGFLRVETFDSATHRLEATFAFVGEGPDGVPATRTITAGHLLLTYSNTP